MAYYVSFYGPYAKHRCETIIQARKYAHKLLLDPEYGEMEVPIYTTKSASYGEFIGMVNYKHYRIGGDRGLVWTTKSRGKYVDHPMKVNGELRE